MALGVYRQVSVGVYEEYSTDGDQTNPIASVHHGRNGTTEEKKLYVRADDAHTYTNIQVAPESTSSDDDIGSGSNPGATGWGAKLLLDTGSDPTESDWEAVDYGAAINISDISDSSTYIPFWFRLESPRNIRIGNKTNIVLSLYYKDTP